MNINLILIFFLKDSDNNALEAVEDPLKGGFELHLKVSFFFFFFEGIAYIMGFKLTDNLPLISTKTLFV